MDSSQPKEFRPRRIMMIATDLDGTFLDADGHLPRENVEAARAAMELGVYFTVATGRMYRSASKFAHEIGANAPIVCYNGAMVRDTDGTLTYHAPLALGDASRCLEMMRERGTYVQAYVGDSLYVYDDKAAEAEYYMKYYGLMCEGIGDELYRLKTAPTKLLVATSGLDETHELIDLLTREFDGRLYVTSSEPNFVEIMDREVNKANALARAASAVGVDMSEVMAIGDGENDAEMIAASGVGVAVANAREAAIEASDVIAPSRDEHGPAWAIDYFVLSRR